MTLTKQRAIKALQRAEEHANYSHFYWAKLYWPTRTGRPLDFKKHQYLRALYHERSPDIYLQKAAQLGASEWLLSRQFFIADKLNRNAGYFFPAQSQLGDFVQMRVDPQIELSPYLRNLTARQGLENKQKSADKMGLKRVGNAFVVFRGAQNSKQTTSVPLDAAALDEYDRFGNVGKSQIMKRMNHSDLKWSAAASTPTIEGRGINEMMEETDQMEWWVKCFNCKKVQILNYWENVDEATKQVVCAKCSAPMDVGVIQAGQWKPSKPNAKKRGYYMTGFLNPYLDVAELVKNMHHHNETMVQETYNQDLGIPYESAEKQIKDSEIDACQREYTIPLDRLEIKGVFAGMDVGKISYLVAGKIDKETGNPMLIGLHKVHDIETDVPRLMNELKILTLVIDANPETNAVAKLIRQFPGRVFAAYYDYTTMIAGKFIKWYDDRVQVHRTASLDEMYGRLKAQRLLLPKNAQYIPGLYDHLKNQKRVESTIRGQQMFIYQDNGKPDHWGHAINYALVASDKIPTSLHDYMQVVESTHTKHTEANTESIFGNLMGKIIWAKRSR